MLVQGIEKCRSELSPAHAEVIRATLPLVGANIQDIAKTFYKTMFSSHPELIKDLFNRGNQKQGAQQKALAASVATFAAMLVNENAPLPDHLLSRIGHKHAALGVTEDQYQIVHDNLFAAIVEVLGADVVTKDVAEAWDAVYWIMARVLIQFEKDLYKEAGVEPGKVWRSVKVAERRGLVNGIVRFTIESTDASKPLPTHQPGQYISVRAQLPDGAGQLRQYSLLDAGVQAGRLSFAVKALEATHEQPAGEVSNWLIQNAQQGKELEVSLPFGDLVLDTSASSPVVLISGGIGATPMIGMLSRLANDKSNRQVLVLHADHSEKTDALAAERHHLVSQLSNAKLNLFYSHGEAGPHITVSHLDLKHVELPHDAQFYLCGSTDFLQAARESLKSMNIDAESVHFELFAPNDWLLDE